jgi:hypothetical protein
MTRRSRSLLVALLLALTASGCKEDPGGPVDPYAAPDFGLRDINPASPSFNEIRSLSEQRGKVVVLYFALFT